MVDYRNIDWSQERPDVARFRPCGLKSQVHDVPELDERLAAVWNELQRSHGDGHARVAQFQLDVEPVVAWFLTRNRLYETSFFGDFFGLALVHQGMKIAPPMPEDLDLGFELENSFVAMGRLAQTISGGGAYMRFEGSDAEVLELVRGFTDAAFGSRYSDTTVYMSWKAWSPWFKGIAWDTTFFWVDKQSGTATVLITTDTD